MNKNDVLKKCTEFKGEHLLAFSKIGIGVLKLELLVQVFSG